MSYPLNGADRFQLYFDSVARKNTGIGNVIRAAVTLEGIIPEQQLRQSLDGNEWMRFLSAFSVKRNLMRVLYRFETDPGKKLPLVTFHQGNPHDVMLHVASRDCNLHSGEPLHVDVVYDTDKTHIVFSVSHILMDHAGIENLLASFTGENNLEAFSAIADKKSSSGRISEAISATMFVTSLAGGSMKRLMRNLTPGKASFESIELTAEESHQVKRSMVGEMKANALSFFLGSSLFALSRHSKLLKGKNYFVPVPIDRRPASARNTLLSNFISFLYFKVSDKDLTSMKHSIDVIGSQMISQARKNIPEKFGSLLDIFRFVPSPLYSTFIELPGRGHSATFAFSLLPNSKLEGRKMMGCSILDVTHYAPVISPPGLNVIFSEFDGRLKVLCSYDENRIQKNEVMSFLGTLKSILLS